MDTVSPERRSEIMSRVRSKDTKPELAIRRLVHGLGYRYRLHRKDLPGTPDLVFSRRRKVIFVHGCFWHSHEGCKLARLPKSRREFWQKKLGENKKRDKACLKELTSLGWTVLIIWECEITSSSLKDKVINFLEE